MIVSTAATTLRSNSSWVSAKNPRVTTTSWTSATTVEIPKNHSKRNQVNNATAAIDSSTAQMPLWINSPDTLPDTLSTRRKLTSP